MLKGKPAVGPITTTAPTPRTAAFAQPAFLPHQHTRGVGCSVVASTFFGKPPPRDLGNGGPPVVRSPVGHPTLRWWSTLSVAAAPVVNPAGADHHEQEDQRQPEQRQRSRPHRNSRGPQHRHPQQQLRRRTAPSTQQDAVLFIGFHPEELDVVRMRISEVLPTAAVDDDASGDADGFAASTALVDVTCGMLPYTVSDVLRLAAAARRGDGDGSGGTGAAVAGAPQAQGGEEAAGAGADVVAVSEGRVVLLVGPAAQAMGAQLNDLLVEWGVVPALVAAYQPKHEHMPLRELVRFLRDAHTQYYSLLQPVWVEPLNATAANCGRATAADTAATAAGADVAGSAAAAPGAIDHLSVLEDVRVVLTAAMDAGEVPSIHGHYRPDAGHVVVLDGLLTAGERGQLVDWLTAPGHNHSGPPPEDKWEMACVDREGDQATWGLQPHVLHALRDDPPPPVVALQTRLAALYPEYDVCHMPADQISDAVAAGGADDEGTPLSSFVGNAVMPGDPCAWHVDADPTTVPPYSPWVHNFGYYHNREPARPLFVSMLLYLNEAWPEDYHAETLFLDPETQLGLFVRPVPGRVVLLEQDLPHRISAPSREAPGPRYSLVWKLVLVPKQASSGRKAGEEQSRAGEDKEPAPFQSICRPEWGEPLRIGSASRRSGIRAFQRGGPRK